MCQCCRSSSFFLISKCEFELSFQRFLFSVTPTVYIRTRIMSAYCRLTHTPFWTSTIFRHHWKSFRRWLQMSDPILKPLSWMSSLARSIHMAALCTISCLVTTDIFGIICKRVRHTCYFFIGFVLQNSYAGIVYTHACNNDLAVEPVTNWFSLQKWMDYDTLEWAASGRTSSLRKVSSGTRLDSECSIPSSSLSCTTMLDARLPVLSSLLCREFYTTTSCIAVICKSRHGVFRNSCYLLNICLSQWVCNSSCIW